MRRRVAGSGGGLPAHLVRYDWRDWRPEPDPDDPAPWYSCWYLGLFDWREARREWATVRGVAERALPEQVTPPTPDLITAAQPEPAPDALPRVNRATVVHRSRPIKLR
ncbi:hypothetical protein GCM10010448_19310 [Streptomyces glomeratus]|uniref:Uncharacterized protein n=1 Tax=Streptomyces glomeratus TaxID=284452 RepID=A0ABP6LE65_9ACTN